MDFLLYFYGSSAGLKRPVYTLKWATNDNLIIIIKKFIFGEALV